MNRRTIFELAIVCVLAISIVLNAMASINMAKTSKITVDAVSQLQDDVIDLQFDDLRILSSLLWMTETETVMLLELEMYDQAQNVMDLHNYLEEIYLQPLDEAE
jgi:hypothetical protein